MCARSSVVTGRNFKTASRTFLANYLSTSDAFSQTYSTKSSGGYNSIVSELLCRHLQFLSFALWCLSAGTDLYSIFLYQSHGPFFYWQCNRRHWQCQLHHCPRRQHIDSVEVDVGNTNGNTNSVIAISPDTSLIP